MMLNKNEKRWLFSIALTIALTGCMDAKVSNNNANDPDMIIIPGEECISEVIYAGDDNCDEQQCGADKNCVCAKKNQAITWWIAGKRKFKLKFESDSPLDSCGDTFKRKKQKCKVKNQVQVNQVFKYEVILDGCGTGTDPRIVIRKSN